MMNTNERPPLLSDEDLMRNVPFSNGASEWMSGASYARREYEAARAKDWERIKELEALCRTIGNGLDEMMRPANRDCDGAHCTGCWKDINGQLVKLLFAAGFKQFEP